MIQNVWILLILYSSHALVANNEGIDKFRLYIYDWPDEVTNAWPPIGNYNHHRLSLQPRFHLNDATGPVVSADRGLHHTHQYSLFQTLVARFKESPYITKNPEEANVFFVPYDIGMDSSTRSSDGALTATNCPRMKPALELLHASPYFRRHGGSDHVVLHSVNQPMLFFVNKYCRKWYEACWNCTKLSIDTYSADVYRRMEPSMTHRWVSIPFPSDYHLSDNVKIIPWADRTGCPRPYALAFSGSVSVTCKKCRHLREVIIKICQENPNDCFLHTLTDHTSNAITGHVHRDKRKLLKGFGPYYNASFCFMPGGDFPTRKAFLDALLTGCVPVTFHNATALDQWPWHWNSIEEASNVMVYISMEDFVADPQKHFTKLVAMSEDSSLMKSMRENIALLGSRMQYNLPGKYHKSPPIYRKDAVDVILEHLFEESRDNIR